MLHPFERDVLLKSASKIVIDVYTDAHRFYPERFMNPNIQDPKEFLFGFGRRQAVLVSYLLILSVFNSS